MLACNDPKIDLDNVINNYVYVAIAMAIDWGMHCNCSLALQRR